MNLRGTLVSAALALLASIAPTAHAQLGVYGTVTVDHVTGIKCQEPDGICGSNDGTINPLGGIGGIFYDFKTYGRFHLGADVRASSVIGNKNAYIYANSPRPRIYSALGGIRASYDLRLLHLKPYAEGLVGFGKANVASGNRSSGFEFRGLVGTDLPILPVLDFRVVELGIGALHNPNPFTNTSSTYPIESVSTGLVFHLPR